MADVLMFPTDGEVFCLQRLKDYFTTYNPVLHLIGSTITLAATTTLTNLNAVEVASGTYTWYSSQGLGAFSAPALDGSNHAYITGNQATFTSNGVGGAISIYGWYIVCNGSLVCAKTYNTPVDMGTSGNVLNVTPTITYKDLNY